MLPIRLYILRHKNVPEMKFPFIDILLKLFWFIVISKIIRFSRYRYIYLLWNLAHCYIGIKIPFFYSIYSIFKFYLNTKNIIIIIIKRTKVSVTAFAVLHWITASRFTQKDYKLLFPDKKQFFNHSLSFLAIEAKSSGTSWFESYKQKHPQLLRSFTPNNCSAVY